MKTKEIPFNAEDLVRSVEQVRDHVTGKRKITLRTTKLKLPKPAPTVSPKDVGRIRARLKVSQPVFAAILNVPTVTAISWEKGRRKPSGAALRLLEIAKKHPEVLNAA
jgi:putative transcriptional regulator